MRPKFRNILFSKYSLLAISCILFALSFIFSKLYTHRSSVAREVKLAEKYIAAQERDFERFIKDTSLIRKLVAEKESLSEFKKLAEKPYGTFVYTANDQGSVFMEFWSDQLAVPPAGLFPLEDGIYFYHLANGYYVSVKKNIKRRRSK